MGHDNGTLATAQPSANGQKKDKRMKVSEVIACSAWITQHKATIEKDKWNADKIRTELVKATGLTDISDTNVSTLLRACGIKPKIRTRSDAGSVNVRGGRERLDKIEKQIAGILTEMNKYEQALKVLQDDLRQLKVALGVAQ